MDQAFYKYQLILLTVICIVLIAYERYLKSKKSPPDHFKDKVEESIEDGHSVLQTNGAAVLTSNVTRAGALQTLMRKYLLVYAILMVRSRRDRPISRARDVTMTPAPSKGPHLLGPAYPPAAVRAGTVGKLSEANDLLFFSWLSVRMSKSVYSPFVTYLLTLYGGYRDHRRRSVLKKED
jgi:hypothetical protein